MEKEEGYIQQVIYRNQENGYTVLELHTEEGNLTCVGTIPFAQEGEYAKVEGEYTRHPVYGRQLKVSALAVQDPEDASAMERYLASGAVKGIGEKMAARIVGQFGEDTLRIMEEEPERLAEVKGISLSGAQEIGIQMAQRREQRELFFFFQKYGISLSMAMKLYGHYKENVYEVVRANPYQIAEDIPGIGFLTADRIAQKAGMEKDSPFRIRSGISDTLMGAAQEGHTYLPLEELSKRAVALLGISREEVEAQYLPMQMDRKIVRVQDDGQDRMYAPYYYNMEVRCAALLEDLNVKGGVKEEEFSRIIREIYHASGREPDDGQVRAVHMAVENGLLLLTGGPGTGKTTTISTMIHYFQKKGMDVALAAPTGRAAKRMSEMTGREARTIHRLLELSSDPDAGQEKFSRNVDNPIEADVVIIDEMSMVDISLLYALLCAVTVGTRLVLVGDTDQLPSVGPGRVFADLVSCGAYPTVRLSHIFRQAKESDIVINAHKICKGEEVLLDNKSRDFFFLQREDARVVTNVMLQLVLQKLPPYVGCTPLEIQVLTPTRKGLLGVGHLNQVLQQYLNPPSPGKKEKQYGSLLFREGDKVMQVRNNYQKEWTRYGKDGIPQEHGAGLFNGDVGIIKEINSFAKLVVVEFDDGHTVEYEEDMLDELELAYALTVHKSQGSEYPAVVMPLLNGPRMLLNRNLLYTAVTRAKKCVVLVGKKEIFRQMEENVAPIRRYSGLKDRILQERERKKKLEGGEG